MRQPLIVLKFGGSLLAGEASLARVVHEVYRWRRAGYGVVGVVSAFAGATDRLLARARELDPEKPFAAAALAALGEAESAALLGAHLERAGVPAQVFAPATLGLCAEGPPLAAQPVALELGHLERALARTEVAVVPGFAAIDRAGRGVLLGRGGSDLTALFLAHALGARARLVKDVDGLFERDPNLGGAPPRRFVRASFADALALGGSLVQPAAVRFAEERGLAFELGRPNSTRPTEVGPWLSRAEAPPQKKKRLRVALLGLGTVGGALARLLAGLPEEFELVAAAARSPAAAARLGLEAGLVQSPAQALGAESDVVVELAGGLEPAGSWASAALAAGRHVVTANKLLLAARGRELRAAACAAGVRLCCSAAVGGSMPLLEELGRLRAAGVVRLRAVLNGTANFVLCALEQRGSHAQALAEARARGLAESDAARDLDGRDAADKLALLAQVLELGDVEIERDLPALERVPLGEPLRQVATLDVGARAACVRLERVGPGDPLFGLRGPRNAAWIELAGGGSRFLSGTGAGAWPTAEAVLGDLQSLVREGYASSSRSRETELMQ